MYKKFKQKFSVIIIYRKMNYIYNITLNVKLTLITTNN